MLAVKWKSGTGFIVVMVGMDHGRDREYLFGIRFGLRPLELLLPRPEDDNGAVL